MSTLRFAAVFLGAAVAAVAVGVALSSVLSWIIALAVGAVAGWWVSLKGGGWPLVVGLVGLFGAAYATSLSAEWATNATLSLTRMLAYTCMFGGILGGAVGSMKREVDRQRSRKAS